MCRCKSPTRIWLFFVLLLWLLLSIARQVFDLIGKLWIPVIFNLLQILSCINGLFAASQQRLSLLLTLTLSSIISILYNAVLILWYAGILGDRTKPLLSAGLPFSHSFFLRYTPSCQSHYNLTTNQWVQHTNCLIPYYNIEGFQALIHIIIAILTMLFSVLLFCQRKAYNKEKKLKRIYTSSNSSSSSSNKQMPNLHNAAIYGEAEAKANNRELPLPPDSINDISSGYMNSSYEAIGGDNFKMNNPKVRKIKNSQNSSRASQRPKSQAQESQSDYSSVTTKSLGTNTSNESVKQRLRPPLNTTYKKKILVNRSVSPIRRISDEGFSEEDEVSRQYSKMRTKSHEPRTQSVAEQRLSQAAFEQLKKDAAKLKQKATMEQNEKQDSGEYLEYIKAERKPSIKNKTSLISFDPKSNSQTLLRVHEHIDEADDNDDDEVGGGGVDEWASTRSVDNGYKEVVDCGIKMRAKRTTSQDSVPSIQAPTLSMNHNSNNLDSGHPSSNSAEQSMSPDWSHAGIYHVTQRPTMSPPLPPIRNEDKTHKIIGYEQNTAKPSPPSYQLPEFTHPQQSQGTAFASYPPPSQQPQQYERRESHGISLSAAIPLLNSLPIQQTSSSSTRFLAQPPPIPDYAIPSDSNSHYFSPDDYGLKLRSSTSPIIGYEREQRRESTQFDSKPPPTAPIILSNQGLLV